MTRKYLDSIAISHPQLARDWHPTLNGVLNPDDVSAGSERRVWWQCPTGNPEHVWDTKVYNRTSGTGCPFCVRRQVCRSKTLALYTDLTSQWHPTLNGDLKPENFRVGSNAKVWWQCPTGNPEHVWDTKVYSRIEGKGCPFCAGRRVCKSNSLATLCPDLTSQWHPTLNGDLKPENFTIGSRSKVWWQCSTGNPKHVWHAKIGPRTRGMGCPHCDESKGEKRIAEVLNRLGIIYRREFIINRCKNKNGLRFDFAVATFDGSPGVIEFQGGQHYRAIEFYGGESAFEATKKRDQIKREFCKENQLRYLEIPYDRFGEIEPLVEGFVKGLLA